jgi:Lon protease-like protein
MSWLVHSERFSIPPVVPVMLLSQAHLFPHTLMPLYIFEPRYREMLQFALERERMWIVGCLKDEEGEGFDNLHAVAGIGMIRACVQNADGTSHMVIQGLQRVRMSGVDMEGSFPLARVEALESVTGAADKLEILSARLLTCVAKHKAAGGQLPKQFEQQLSSIESPEIVADIISAALVTEAPLRQALLEEVDVSKRLQQLVDWFE